MMNHFKKLLALLLALSMVLCFWGCGDDENGTTEPETSSSVQTTPGGSSPEQSEPDDEPGDPEPVQYTYQVTVTDSKGNPMPGVWVQICAGSTCVPKVTDENGVAGYEGIIVGDGDLTAKIITLPEGYKIKNNQTEIVMGDADLVYFVLEAESDAEPAYEIVVIDWEDNPVEGVWVQICAGSTCVPKCTDANGVAVYEDEITGDGELTAKIISIPDGYVLAEDETEEIELGDETGAMFVLRKVG